MTLQKLKNQYGNTASAVTSMILAQPRFAAWKQRDAKDHSVHWIHARAGAGMNVDLQAFADTSEVKGNVVVHFFCNDKN
jgi:hypothetical protein